MDIDGHVHLIALGTLLTSDMLISSFDDLEKLNELAKSNE